MQWRMVAITWQINFLHVKLFFDFYLLLLKAADRQGACCDAVISFFLE